MKFLNAYAKQIEALKAEANAALFEHAKKTVVANVKRGVKLLDKEMPSWFKKINPDILDMSETHLCVLGQMWDPENTDDPDSSGFKRGLLYLGMDEEQAVEHGFAIFDGTFDHDDFALTNDQVADLDAFHEGEWKTLLTHRLSGPKKQAK
jgi:hypothetical protein